MMVVVTPDTTNRDGVREDEEEDQVGWAAEQATSGAGYGVVPDFPGELSDGRPLVVPSGAALFALVPAK